MTIGTDKSSSKMTDNVTTFNIDAPRWDQNTFIGRLKHFFNITDPRTLLVSEHELDSAKALVESCRAGTVPPGTSVEQLFYAKKLYDSAFHPDSGEKMNLIGRMSFQVPGGMAITGFMLQFYRTVPAVVFWQWVNQSFNAIVNYTNRNAASPISLKQIGVAYFTATSTALVTAVGLNLYTKGLAWETYEVKRQNVFDIENDGPEELELINGVTVTDENDNILGTSRLLLLRFSYRAREIGAFTENTFFEEGFASSERVVIKQMFNLAIPTIIDSREEIVESFDETEDLWMAEGGEAEEVTVSARMWGDEGGDKVRAAVKGITQVVVSRIAMAAPGMIVLPIIMERLEKYPFIKKIQVLHAPLQTVLVGGFLLFMVPVACALFPQRSSIALLHLEPDLRESIVAKYGDKVSFAYFNKGL
ncbi:hypothetical protein JD844_006915 [Phrynosoma platyrhinos]|uniref:Sidoreflexin n=1 Tax=Phrynosoma platyrhinos TaxID=52577 RepID=A0ABQ7T2D2_PHRPL|nr:hypothetical protein JD844_006915 [Phrynosoma platyrhinos]